MGATGVVGQLQDALNTIWEVAPKPGRGLMGFLKDHFLSLGLVLGIGFLLLVSLSLSAALAAVASFFGGLLSHAAPVLEAANFAVSLVVVTLLFAMIYKLLPDAEIAWGDVRVGAVITSLLFMVGKSLIGIYLGRSGLGSTYGAAGSLVVLLVWVYYSSLILFFGAEFTKVYANRFGSRIVPSADAVPVTEEARAEQGMPRTENLEAEARRSPAHRSDRRPRGTRRRVGPGISPEDGRIHAAALSAFGPPRHPRLTGAARHPPCWPTAPPPSGGSIAAEAGPAPGSAHGPGDTPRSSHQASWVHDLAKVNRGPDGRTACTGRKHGADPGGFSQDDTSEGRSWMRKRGSHARDPASSPNHPRDGRTRAFRGRGMMPTHPCSVPTFPRELGSILGKEFPMRCLARIGLALFGWALAAPSALWADPPARQHRTGLFRSQHLCPECQRAQLRAQGIEVPPPPSLPRGILVRNETCTQCQGRAMASGPMMASGPVMVADRSNAPGYAVVGGMVATAEPSPIGVTQANYATVAPPSGGASDAARRPARVMPQLPPPPTPITSPPARSPHILGHMFGLTSLGREQREAWERRRRESHASISYDPQYQQITDLPASMVYGR